VADSVDRRLFLAALGSAGISACSAGTVPFAAGRSFPNAAPLAAHTPGSALVYDHLAWGASYNPATKNLYVAGGPFFAVVGPSGTKLYKGSPQEVHDCHAVAADLHSNAGAYIVDAGLGQISLISDGGGIETVNSYFGNPVGLAFDYDSASGKRKLYVCNDVGNNPDFNNTVIEITIEGFIVRTLARTKSPRAVAVDGVTKMVYVADFDEDSIVTIDNKSLTVGTLGSGFVRANGVARRTGGDVFVTDGTGLYRLSDAGKKTPLISDLTFTGVSVDDANGDLYVSDNINGVIRLSGL
jgi:DNA-binding beta-propeller fold protein YncE